MVTSMHMHYSIYIDRRVSILPSDLDIVNDLINTILELLEEIQEGELQLDVPDFVSTICVAVCTEL